jgi:glycosyltransferase involved in cell wall biosynthesis
MPVKNGANYLQEALDGIKLQNVAVEIIVVDDASDDNTAQIAESFGCVVLSHKINKGLVASKNTALKVAKGKYIMFHDHDDVMNRNALSQMLKELEENSEISAVMANLQDFFSPELSKENRAKIIIREQPYSHLFSGAILIRREVFDKIGFFDESLRAGDVICWKNKMDESGLEIKKLDFVSVNRRIHNCNFGVTNKGQGYQDYASILRAKIKRNLPNKSSA